MGMVTGRKKTYKHAPRVPDRPGKGKRGALPCRAAIALAKGAVRLVKLAFILHIPSAWSCAEKHAATHIFTTVPRLV